MSAKTRTESGLPEMSVASLARSSEPATAKVQWLADWLRHDIRRRGLQPGDRYMTSEETARMHEVSTGIAHQAMRILVEEDILDRRRKQGTFVGPAVEPPAVKSRPKVFVICPSDATRDATYARISETVCPALVRTLGGAALQLEYLPQDSSMSFLRGLASEAEAEGNLAGFVLVRSTYEVQEFFQERRGRLPAVVCGGVYPGITELPWINVDQHDIGRRTAEYVLRKAHRRVAVLMHEHWTPGDSHFISGMTEFLEAADERLARFEICSLPQHERPIRHQIQQLLASSDRPTVIVARMAHQISVMVDVAKGLGLNIPGEVDVVLGNLEFVSPLSTTIPHAVSKLSMDEVGKRLGEMLSELRHGRQPEPRGYHYEITFTGDGT